MSNQQPQADPPRSDRRTRQRREKQVQVAAERRGTERRKEPRRTLEWIEFYVEQHEEPLEPPEQNPAD